MFAKQIIDSDAFLDMPMSARLLYYDLAMRSDDDGFNNSPRKVMRTIGATTDDMNILVARKFIIPFDNGVVVIKHWRIHNYIRKDTYNSTNYKEQKAMLEYDENNAYRLIDGNNSAALDEPSTTRGRPVDDPWTTCQRPVDDPSTQVRLGKDRLGKYSLVKEREGKESIGECEGEREPSPALPKAEIVEKPVDNSNGMKLGRYGNIELSQKELAMLKLKYPAQWERMVDDLSEYMNTTGKHYDRHYDILTGWAGGSV